MTNAGRDFLLLLVLWATFVEIRPSPESESIDPTTGTHKYCGRNLVNVLTMVCDGIYNYQIPIKDSSAAETKKIPQLREKRDVVTIFQPSSHPTRYRRGAYDECCRKGCSLDEMVGYCGNA